MECVEVGDVVTLDDHALRLEKRDASAYGYIFEDHLLRHVSDRGQSNDEERGDPARREDTHSEAQTKRPKVLLMGTARYKSDQCLP